MSGHVAHGTKPGPQPYLTVEEEKSLTTHLIDATKLGCAKKINRMAENVLEKKDTLRKKNIQ